MSVQMNNMLQMLNNNQNNQNNQNKPNSSYVQSHHINTNLDKWISQTRNILLKTEQRAISERIKQWTKIINESVNLIASKLHISTAHLPKYKDTLMTNINNTYLHFIRKYKYTINNSPLPSNINECIAHGQNWLNEHRGQQYSLTLYPEIIRHAAKHSSNLSRFMYRNNVTHQEMYNNTLMYQCIYRLFKTQVTVPDEFNNNKQIYLLDPVSIKVNPNKSQQNTIAQLIATYAHDPQFYAKFDKHKTKAKFFSEKYESELMKLMQSLNMNKNSNSNENSNSTSNSTSNSPSAPPLPPPPASHNDLKKEQDDNTEISSVFSTSSIGSREKRDGSLPHMPSLQKPPKQSNVSNQTMQTNNNNHSHNHGLVNCKMEKRSNVTNVITQPDKPAVPPPNDSNTNSVVSNTVNNNNVNSNNNNNNNKNVHHQQHTHSHNRPHVNVNTSSHSSGQNNNNNNSSRNMNMSNMGNMANVYNNNNNNNNNNNGNINASMMHQHQNNIQHNNNQIKQLLQTMNDNNVNVNVNNGNNMNMGNVMSGGNKHIMMTGRGMNNAMNKDSSGAPIVTFTNQQHKMILHLLNQLISTYNRQQMNIVYLNNRVQQLECALAKQTAKVEAIELKANTNNNNSNNNNNNNNNHKKHAKHSHNHRHSHAHNNVSPNNNINTSSVNVNNNNNNSFRFRGNATPKATANRAMRAPPNTNNTRQSPKSVNMQNVDAHAAQKILRAHGIELNQLLNLVVNSPNQTIRTQNIGPQRPNNNNNIIVNGNPNINQIQMRVPINNNNNPPPPQGNNNGNNNNASNIVNNNNNNNNVNGNLGGNNGNSVQGILRLLSNLGNGTNKVNMGNLLRRQSTGNMNLRTNNSNINVAVNAPNNGNNNNSPNHHSNQMSQIPTLGKQNNNMNMAHNNNNNTNNNNNGGNTNVAALMVPSLPKMNAPNPNIRQRDIIGSNNNVNKNAIKENKVKIKKQPNPTPNTPVLGAQTNRKRNTNMDNGNDTPPQKKRRMDHQNMNNQNMNNHNMNVGNNNNNNNNIMNNLMNQLTGSNPAMLQMLMNQLSGNNASHTQNQ